MTTMHAPGTGLGGGDLGRRSRQAAVAAAVVLAVLAIGVPFLVRALNDRDATVTTSARDSRPDTTSSGGRSRSGSGSDLPSLLPAASPALVEGEPVRVGDITTGRLHRGSAGWQVLVRWDGRPQPLSTRGPVTLAAPTWVSRQGLLYTRLPAGVPGRFHVYAWEPQGGSAYVPPSLVATPLGDVCFDRAFTTFGRCS